MRAIVALICLFGCVSASPLLGESNVVMDTLIKHIKGITAGHFVMDQKTGDLVRVERRSEEVVADFPTKPVGLFISACQDFSQVIMGRKVSLSVTTARRFGSDGSMFIDETEYIGDPNCQPNTSDTLAKFQLSGQLTMRGKNAAAGFPANTQRVSYQITNGTYLFPASAFDAPYIQEANANCPCGGRWVGGVQRSIAASQCTPPPQGASDFCMIISGQTLYGNLLFINSDDYIVNTADYDERIGWTTPLNKTFLFQGASESGDTTPSDCDYIRWSACGNGVKNAADVCSTCAGLECDGCIFRELPTDDGTTDWDECCPCIHYYSERYNVPWMNIPC